jgi:hypothetical protein
MATVEEIKMLEMKLATLRKEDEIRVRPPVAPTMQQVFKQALPRSSPGNALAKQWPAPQTFVSPQPQSTPPWGAQVEVVFRDISGIHRKTEVAYVRKMREGDD